MPAFTRKTLGSRGEAVLVELPILLRGDDGDLVVELAVLVDGDASLAVAEGMSVKLQR
jgi:hypothetical protein